MNSYTRIVSSPPSPVLPNKTFDDILSSIQTEKAAAPPPYSAFSSARRRFIIGVVTAAGFFGPLCGAVYLPSLVLFQDIFKASATTINATVSVYMAVFAVVPLFGAYASDFGGRKTVYMFALGSFLIANLLLALFPPHIASLFILRVFQAFGSCIVFSVGAGTVADITEPKNRASTLAIFLMGPQLGPILGPLIGGQFADISRWRWIFGFLFLTALPVYILITFCLPETLRSLVGNGAPVAHQSWFSRPHLRTKPYPTQPGDKAPPKPPRPSFRKLFRLMKYPPHLIVSIDGALQFTAYYAIYITFPRVWKAYGWSTQEVGYAYLIPGITIFITSMIAGKVSDWMRATAIRRSIDGKVSPERRVSIQIVGFVLAAGGKVLYGWGVEKHVHPALALLGSALAAMGTAIIFVTSTSFQTECDPSQAASLVALGGLLRNLGAAVAAAVMDKVVEGLGYGWCFTILSVVDMLCIPGILLIMATGKKWRENLKEDLNK